MDDNVTAVVASPILAIRQVLAGIAREAGFRVLESSLRQATLTALIHPTVVVVLLHHPDVEVVLRLVQYAQARGLPVLALADRPADAPVLRQAGAVLVSMQSSWFTAAELLRKQLPPPPHATATAPGASPGAPRRLAASA